MQNVILEKIQNVKCYLRENTECKMLCLRKYRMQNVILEKIQNVKCHFREKYRWQNII